jgi:hypothetical protein
MDKAEKDTQSEFEWHACCSSCHLSRGHTFRIPNQQECTELISLIRTLKVCNCYSRSWRLLTNSCATGGVRRASDRRWLRMESDVTRRQAIVASSHGGNKRAGKGLHHITPVYLLSNSSFIISLRIAPR